MSTVNIFSDSYADGFDERIDIISDDHSWNMQLSLTPTGGGQTLTLPESKELSDLNIALKVMKAHKGFFTFRKYMESYQGYLETIFTNLTIEEAKAFYEGLGYSCSKVFDSEPSNVIHSAILASKNGQPDKKILVLQQNFSFNLEEIYDLLEVSYPECPEDSIYCDCYETVSLFEANQVDVKVDIKGHEPVTFTVPRLVDKQLAWKLLSLNAGFTLFEVVPPRTLIIYDENELDNLVFPLTRSYNVFGDAEQKELFKQRFADGYEITHHKKSDDFEFISEQILFEKEGEKNQVRIMKDGVILEPDGGFGLFVKTP